MIKIKATREFSGTSFGNAKVGDILVLTPSQARHVISLGFAEFAEDLTKKPLLDTALIPLSQVGQASPLSIAITQQAEAQPSAQTQLSSDLQSAPTLSTAAIKTGGEDTTERQKKRARNSGRKTKEQLQS
jgi:hypothetical protein